MTSATRVLAALGLMLPALSLAQSTLELPNGAEVQVPGELGPAQLTTEDGIDIIDLPAAGVRLMLFHKQGPTHCLLALTAQHLSTMADAQEVPRPDWAPTDWHDRALAQQRGEAVNYFLCAATPQGALQGWVIGPPSPALTALLTSLARAAAWAATPPPTAERPVGLHQLEREVLLGTDWHYEAREGYDVLQRLAIGRPALGLSIERKDYGCDMWLNHDRFSPSPYRRIEPDSAPPPLHPARIVTPLPGSTSVELCQDLGESHRLVVIQIAAPSTHPDLEETIAFVARLLTPPTP